MSLRAPAAILLATGLGAVASALLWWSLSYGQVWRNDYISLVEASRCLVAQSTICQLASSLCGTRHTTIIAVYSPVLLWTGFAVIFSSALAPRRRASIRS